MRINIFQAVFGSRAGIAGTWRRKKPDMIQRGGEKGGEVEEEGSKGEQRRGGKRSKREGAMGGGE